MTNGATAELDPYVLSMPSPDSPVVLPEWISPGNTHPNSRYQDLIWSVAPLIDNPGTIPYETRRRTPPVCRPSRALEAGSASAPCY